MAIKNVINDLKELEGKLENSVLTIGNFDGVHRGHIALFNKVKELAADVGGHSVVMTFDPHPVKVMNPGNEPLLITPISKKLELISKECVDVIICLPFSKKFASISPEDFVKNILVEKIGIKEMVVGYDYAFGSGRKGDINLLRKMGNDLGFNVHMVAPIYLNGTLVSSTSIRKLVREGNLGETKRLLGREYQIAGTVVKGYDRGGKILGFPTANIVPKGELIPRKGVYAVGIELGDKMFQGVCNIGYNPTFGDSSLTIETHIFDFSDNIVGEQINVIFIEHMRDEKRFNSIQELADGIADDITRAQEIFSVYGDS